jgi:NADH:ubiquinone oxidoreductase subunit F (NADH-binding)/NADH:ubiquinone oxidoreductase subunit E
MSLLRQLHALQEERGFLTPELLRELAASARVPLHRLQELVCFYPHFRTSPPPRVDVAVCRDMSCWLRGAPNCLVRARKELEVAPSCEVREVSCLGRCDQAPAALVNGNPVSLPETTDIRTSAKQQPPAWPLRPRVWRSDPYESVSDRYGLLKQLLSEDGAVSRVLGTIIESGLRGMGGAGFPTAAKWELVRKQTRTPKYVICNADESEPGTFKDRVILAKSPHLVIEGMMLAALVVGAEKGILYIRHEYGPERSAFENELSIVREQGLVGSDIRGTGFSFDIEVFVSPGGYILGEETALLEALEDRRGEPRTKPPYPATCGLHGQPTLINNVESLAVVPGIVQRGADWWRRQGKPGFAGLKFMALSGHVQQPGVYEVPMGTTVRELIQLGGGVLDGRELKGFVPGGASSRFLPAAAVDTPLDFDTVLRAGSVLGSGAVVVVAEGTDMRALATNVVQFFRNESCGKCVPCRVGTQKAVEILERRQAGKASAQELHLLPELGETLLQTSLCGLGQVALNPILSVAKHWPEEV